MKKIIILLMSIMIIAAFSPAMASATSFAYLSNSQTINEDKSITIETNCNDLTKVSIIFLDQYDNELYNLGEGDDYTWDSNGIITITEDFIHGLTGFHPDRLYKNRLRIEAVKSGDTDCIYQCWVENVTIYNISGHKHSAIKKQIYSGKQKTPEVTVKNATEGKEFKVVFEKSTRIKIGTYYVKIKGINGFKGSKRFSFQIIPKTPVLKSAKRTKTTATIKWKKVSNASGYQVKLVKVTHDETLGDSYTTYRSAYVKKNTILTKKFKSLKKSKYNAVRIRAYKTVNGKKIYSNYKTKLF